MRKYYFLFIIFSFFLPVFVFAQNLEGISYPIEELGGCENKEACRLFCDKFENLEKCLNFSEKNALLSECQLTNARKFLNAINSGLKLLSCQSKEECQTYCLNPANFKECVNFAESAGFLSHDEALLYNRTKGKGPANCQSKEDCLEYCQDENHLDECLKFALDNGFIVPAQVAFAIQIRDLAAKGGPGGCFGLKACADYCSQSKNLIECIDFGQKSGIIKKEEIDQMEQLAKNGGPGGCKTREECKEYCGVAQNALECFNFMAENGYLTPKYVEAMENQIESIEGSIKQKFEQFRQYYDSEEDYNTEVQKDIDERLKYYKEIIEEYKKKNNLE